MWCAYRLKLHLSLSKLIFCLSLQARICLYTEIWRNICIDDVLHTCYFQCAMQYSKSDSPAICIKVLFAILTSSYSLSTSCKFGARRLNCLLTKTICRISLYMSISKKTRMPKYYDDIDPGKASMKWHANCVQFWRDTECWVWYEPELLLLVWIWAECSGSQLQLQLESLWTFATCICHNTRCKLPDRGSWEQYLS